MTPEEARERAQALFKGGMNCAQAVVCTFSEELGLDRRTAARISQPFGGGMSRMREVCGSVSGMLMAAGLAVGSDDASDSTAKNGCYAAAQELAGQFRERNGSIVCRELLGLAPMGQTVRAAEGRTAVCHVVQNPESEARTADYYKKRPCALLVGDSAEIFCRWLNERNAPAES